MSAGFLAAAAFLFGVVSISSPCCLPRLPGYVAYVSGDQGARRAGRAVTGIPIAIHRSHESWSDHVRQAHKTAALQGISPAAAVGR